MSSGGDRDRGARATRDLQGPSRRAAVAALLVAQGTWLGSPAVVAAESGPSNVADAQTPSVIEEVVVTARKRPERLLDTPVAAAVLSRGEIERYRTTDLAQLTARLPGLTIEHQGGGNAGGNMTIRGVGQQTTDYGAEQPVALVLDGMAFTRGHILDVGFFDVASVEVLKGPQTLFFGKNSPAGVVNVTSVSPGNEFEGFVRGSYEFAAEDRVVEAGLSVPVTEALAFRIAGRRQDMKEGYLDNSAEVISPNPLPGEAGLPLRGASYDVYPQQEQNVVRFTTVFEPTANFDATLKLFRSFSKRNDSSPAVLYACADGIGSHPYLNNQLQGQLIPDTTQTCMGDEPRAVINGPLPPAEVIAADPFIDVDEGLFNRVINHIHTLEMNYRLGSFNFATTTGYWDYTHEEYTDYSYTSHALTYSKQGESGKSWTQELRVRSDFDDFPVNFMVGAFYEDMERDLDAPVRIFPAGPDPSPGFYQGSYLTYHQHWENWIESWSVFGQVEWEVLPSLTLSSGVRYTEEERDSIGGNLYERFGIFSPEGVMYEPSDEFSDTSPQVTVSWRPTNALMLYGAFKTGFQSSGISNPGTVPDLTSLTPAEQSEALTFEGTDVQGFEGGIKGELLGRRVVGDIAVYRYEYTDLQVAVFDPLTTTFSVQNAAAAVNKGIEVQGQAQATDWLQLRLSAQYNHLEYDEYPNAQCYPGQPVDDSGPGCHVGPNGSLIQNMAGERYGGAPFQVNAGFTFDRAVLPRWALSVTGDVIHYSEGKRTLRQPNTSVPARTVANFSTRVYSRGGPWEAALICSNCFDETYVTSIGNKPLGKAGDLTGAIGLPRLVTLELTYRLD